MDSEYPWVIRESAIRENPWCVIPADESCVKVMTMTGTVTVYRTGRIEVEPRDE